MNETNQMTASASVSYYVGDLAYVMHDEWSEVCDLTLAEGVDEGQFELADGRQFILFSTAYGDGCYPDQMGRSYAVDSGTIGAIRVDDIRDPEFDRIIQNGLGHVHEFPSEIDESDCFNEDGVLTFYNVVIDTAGSDYDDEGEDYDWDNADEDA